MCSEKKNTIQKKTHRISEKMAEIDGLPIQPAIPNNNPTQNKDTHNIWKDYRKLKTYLILRDKNSEKVLVTTYAWC